MLVRSRLLGGGWIDHGIVKTRSRSCRTGRSQGLSWQRASSSGVRSRPPSPRQRGLSQPIHTIIICHSNPLHNVCSTCSLLVIVLNMIVIIPTPHPHSPHRTSSHQPLSPRSCRCTRQAQQNKGASRLRLRLKLGCHDPPRGEGLEVDAAVHSEYVAKYSQRMARFVVAWATTLPR